MTTAKCICKEERDAVYVHFCEACQCDTDFCLACTPQPPCTCVYIREDVTDASDCQLCDPDSHYNFLVRTAERKAAAMRKPAGREVAEPFRTIIEKECLEGRCHLQAESLTEQLRWSIRLVQAAKENN